MASDPNNREEFTDPLENYDAPCFDDPIEQALHDESIILTTWQELAERARKHANSQAGR